MDALEPVVMLPAPNKRDALDYECTRRPQRVRLVRNASPSGEQRVLMTNLFDDALYPADCFAEAFGYELPIAATVPWVLPPAPDQLLGATGNCSNLRKALDINKFPSNFKALTNMKRE